MKWANVAMGVVTGALLATAARAAPPAGVQQAVQAVANQVRQAGREADACRASRKCLEQQVKRLDAALQELDGLDRGLTLSAREELGIAVAWQVEPAAHEATVAIQLAAGQTATEDDRLATTARTVATQLYQWRNDVLRAGRVDAEAVCARISPLLDKARPAKTASRDAREDFEQTAVAAAWDLRRALYAGDDPHASLAWNRQTRLVRDLMRQIEPAAADVIRQPDKAHLATFALAAEAFVQAKATATVGPDARFRDLTEAETSRFLPWLHARLHDMHARLQEAHTSVPPQLQPLSRPATPTTRP